MLTSSPLNIFATIKNVYPTVNPFIPSFPDNLSQFFYNGYILNIFIVPFQTVFAKYVLLSRTVFYSFIFILFQSQFPNNP